MTDTTKERAQFERWWREQNGYDDPLYREWAVLGWMARAEQSTETPPEIQQAIYYLLLCWSVFYAKLPDGEYDGLGEMRQAVIELKRFESKVAEAPRPVGTPEGKETMNAAINAANKIYQRHNDKVDRGFGQNPPRMLVSINEMADIIEDEFASETAAKEAAEQQALLLLSVNDLGKRWKAAEADRDTLQKALKDEMVQSGQDQKELRAERDRAVRALSSCLIWMKNTVETGAVDEFKIENVPEYVDGMSIVSPVPVPAPTKENPLEPGEFFITRGDGVQERCRYAVPAPLPPCDCPAGEDAFMGAHGVHCKKYAEAGPAATCHCPFDFGEHDKDCPQAGPAPKGETK